jgi:hypothetical protein
LLTSPPVSRIVSAMSKAPTLDTPAAVSDPTRASGAELSVRKIALGEELPIFCEKCGYALHGLPQQVCQHCTIRQFKCPECGHHQPINTLRPAAQKIFGRMRAAMLAFSVFFKLNFFGWLLVAWVAMGVNWSYEYHYERAYSTRTVGGSRGGPYYNRTADLRPRELDVEEMAAFSTFALAFGVFGRMLLLRWRRGYAVGLTLSTLVCLAVILGAYLRTRRRDYDIPAPPAFTSDFFVVLTVTVVALTLGASSVWGIWTALVHVFLPRRTARALLDWQSALSDRAASDLARQ